jgi:hypothetical protein
MTGANAKREDDVGGGGVVVAKVAWDLGLGGHDSGAGAGWSQLRLGAVLGSTGESLVT